MAHWRTCPCAPICCTEILMAISNAQTGSTPASATPQSSPLVMRIIGAVALAHLINDLIQSVLPSIYPMLKANYGLTFTQVGLITLTFQLTASLLQPWVGYYTDRHPKPWLLPAGTVCTLIGILMMSQVGSFPLILLAAGLIGIGSSTFTRKLLAWRDWRLTGVSAWRNRPFRSAVMPARPSVHCWPRRSSFPTVRGTSRGLGCSRCLLCLCSIASAVGTPIT